TQCQASGCFNGTNLTADTSACPVVFNSQMGIFTFDCPTGHPCDGCEDKIRSVAYFQTDGDCDRSFSFGSYTGAGIFRIIKVPHFDTPREPWLLRPGCFTSCNPNDSASCDNGKIQSVATCGDLFCEAAETEQNCPQDCATATTNPNLTCGNGRCDKNEHP